MRSKLVMNYRRLTRVTPYETKIVDPRAIPYGSYQEDTLALALALIGIAFMIVVVVSMLVTFSII